MTPPAFPNLSHISSAALAVIAAAVLSFGCNQNPAAVASSHAPAETQVVQAVAIPETVPPLKAAAQPKPANPKPALKPKPSEDKPSEAKPEPAPAPTRPKADRTPVKPGEAEKVTFDDLIIGMQANLVYRPWMLSERAQELDGKRIRIPGYMHGGAAASSGIKEFVLLRNKECKFGKDGQADHLTMVTLREGTKTAYAPDIIVEGTLHISPYTGTDGNTWSIYKLDDAVLK